MAYLPANLINSKRNLNPGSYHDVVIESVDEETKLSQITVSLDSPQIVRSILVSEVPEIAEGLINIKDIQRQPGERTKVVLELGQNATESLEIIGAVMGENSQRFETILARLNDGVDLIQSKVYPEKLDIVLYNSDTKEFIKNALTPAKVVDVVLKEEGKNSYYVIVNKSELTKAIGRRGINTSLASKIVDAHLDVISIDEAKKHKIPFTMPEKIYIPSVDLSETKPRRARNKIADRIKFDNSINFNFKNFDEDIAAFKEMEQQSFENNEQFDDFDFETLMKEAEAEYSELSTDEELAEEKNTDSDNKNDETISLNDYKKAKEIADNFKSDSDLMNFGLDSQLDLSEFDEDD
ncbi:UNVERIFIED_CONTAM: hypothetical protein O8I53_07590 [Campylobacter lari]